MLIKDKSVLITGANRGIGQAIARAFAKEGATIIAAMRTPDESQIGELKNFGAKSAVVKKLDLDNFQNIEKFLVQIKKEKLKVDILVNNAGLLTGGLLEKQDIQKVYEMIQVNLISYIHLTAGILPQMLERKEGKIINNSSISGILNLPSASTYSAAKTGVAAFTRSLDQELAGTGVSTLLLITPGVETRMYQEVRETYRGHLNVDMVKTIEPEVWAQKVIDAVKTDKKELWPNFTQTLVGRLYTIFPSLIRFGTKTQFRR